MLHCLELLTRHGIADVRMVGAYGAGEPFVHQVLNDEVVGRVDDATQYERCRSGNDTRFGEIIAVRRQVEPDAGRNFLQPRHNIGDEDELA